MDDPSGLQALYACNAATATSTLALILCTGYWLADKHAAFLAELSKIGRGYEIISRVESRQYATSPAVVAEYIKALAYTGKHAPRQPHHTCILPARCWGRPLMRAW